MDFSARTVLMRLNNTKFARRSVHEPTTWVTISFIRKFFTKRFGHRHCAKATANDTLLTPDSLRGTGHQQFCSART
jgi:hypothetical protein